MFYTPEISPNQESFESKIKNSIQLIEKIHPHLEAVHTYTFPPEDEPCTAGFFEPQIQPTGEISLDIYLAKDFLNITQELMALRPTSAKAAAELLGIDEKKLSAELLSLFIIAHEFGHADDFIRNYLNDPNLSQTEALNAWDMHYDMNLLALPVQGLSPAELHDLIKQGKTFEELLAYYPEIMDYKYFGQIHNLDDLVRFQETEYRQMPYESQADQFAANFLLNNAEKLGIEELLDKQTSKAA